jgi:hypothetical protein
MPSYGEILSGSGPSEEEPVDEVSSATADSVLEIPDDPQATTGEVAVAAAVVTASRPLVVIEEPAPTARFAGEMPLYVVTGRLPGLIRARYGTGLLRREADALLENGGDTLFDAERPLVVPASWSLLVGSSGKGTETLPIAAVLQPKRSRSHARSLRLTAQVACQLGVPPIIEGGLYGSPTMQDHADEYGVLESTGSEMAMTGSLLRAVRRAGDTDRLAEWLGERHVAGLMIEATALLIESPSSDRPTPDTTTIEKLNSGGGLPVSRVQLTPTPELLEELLGRNSSSVIDNDPIGEVLKTVIEAWRTQRQAAGDLSGRLPLQLRIPRDLANHIVGDGLTDQGFVTIRRIVASVVRDFLA